MRIAAAVALSPEQKQALEQMARARSMSARLVERARIVLLAADGMENQQIAGRMNMTPKKAARWRNHFVAGGIAALRQDASRPGRTRTITDGKMKRVVEMTLHHKPANATHWSTRVLSDPEFTENLEDIVGLYLNPPEHAIVLCADEKSRILALDALSPACR